MTNPASGTPLWAQQTSLRECSARPGPPVWPECCSRRCSGRCPRGPSREISSDPGLGLLCHWHSVAVMPEYGADPQVVPYLLYEDAGAAMDWLIRVFGFTERVRDRQSDGAVRHGELLTGNGGVIMLGSPGPGFRGPARLGEVTQLQCITITGLLAHRERAQTSGADVSEVAMRAGRAHSYMVDDLEGHRWYFSEPL
jgi:uncharacterized glyoxalase superfamily protein PhnB